MANKSINKTGSNDKVKKRNVFGFVAGLLLSATAVGGGAFLFFGSLPILFTIMFAAVFLGAGILSALVNSHKIFKRNEKKNNSKNEKTVISKNKENLMNKQAKSVKVATPTKQVNNTAQEIKDRNMTQYLGTNTFAIYDINGEIIKDSQNRKLIFKINEENDRDIRKIFPELLKNELKDMQGFRVSILDQNADKTIIPVSKSTQSSFLSDLNAVYKCIRGVREEYKKSNQDIPLP